MIKKLHYLFKAKTDSDLRGCGWLTSMLIILLYFGGMSSTNASNGFDNNKVEDPKTILEDLQNYPQIVKSYNITDASTEGKSCFPTKGKGVIFQRADGCQGSHHIWRVADKLTMHEYDNDTAAIIGTVTDEYGKIGKVNIALYNKSDKGNTWQAECYQKGITDPRSLYQAFNGTITIDGKAFSVELKQAEQHYILADGAGFEPGKYGFGAWTGGTFGGCTEWFGNLDLIEVNCDLTVDAGEDQENCSIDEILLTANAENASDCANIISSYKLIDSKLEPGCFTADAGVIFTKGQNCSESLTIWSAQNDLMLNEYDDNTAKISGSVKNQYGKIGIVDVTLTDKEYTGTTWSASCYLDGISGKETYYRSFNGTVTVDGIPMTVGTRFNAHYILANGAGFDSNQYGLGAWTGGSFGSCTEWFGNLVPKTIDNSDNELNYMWSTTDGNILGNANQQSITVNKAGTYKVIATDCEDCEAIDTVVVTMNEVEADAGNDQVICKGDAAKLTATGGGTYLWSTGETTASISVSPEVETTYTVTVTSDEGCEDTDEVMVKVDDAKADAGIDQTICEGDEATLTVTGEGTYLWSTGEITQSITVNPEVTTEYSVIVTNGNCEAMDDVIVNVHKKVVIGDYVWLDENHNGMQDDGATGIRGMSVKLYECSGDLIDSTTTNEDGYYQFEVCPGTGDYNVVFGDIPEGLKFTASNQGDATNDSNADAGGVTACFTITDKDDLTIDAGLVEICDINLEVIEEAKICADGILELTATLTDNTEECEGGCIYPIIEQERCYGPEGDFEIWMVSVTDGKNTYHKFKASEQRFETLDNGSAKYTATATDGIDTIEVDVTFTGYTTVPGPNGPKSNDCQQYDMSDWEYWSTWSGTISSQNHGIFTLSMKGTYFQMGVGADVTRSGFGASGWFYAAGGDGYYVDGDINVALEECIEKSATFEWTTTDGNIISDVNQKTITVDSPGTYEIKAINCIDCIAVKKIVVTEDILCSTFAKSGNTPKMMKVYPVPTQSGGTLTIEFDLEDDKNAGVIKATSLKATVNGNSKKENIVIVLYDMTGRVISTPRAFDIIGGKAVIYLDLEYMPTGKYIVKAMSGTWNDSKNIIVR